MSQGKGIAVCHHGPHRPRAGTGLQRRGKIPRPVARVFHQQGVGSLGHGIKVQIGKHHPVFRLGIEKQVADAPAKGLFPQLGDHRGGQTLALAGGIHRDAFENIARKRAGGDDFLVLQQIHRVFDALVIIQTLPGEKVPQRFLPPRAQRRAVFQFHQSTSREIP